MSDCGPPFFRSCIFSRPLSVRSSVRPLCLYRHYCSDAGGCDDAKWRAAKWRGVIVWYSPWCRTWCALWFSSPRRTAGRSRTDHTHTRPTQTPAYTWSTDSRSMRTRLCTHTHTHTHTHIDGVFWKSNPSTKLSPNLIKSCKREFVSRNFSGKETLSVVFWYHLYFRRLEKTETLKTIDDDHVVQSSFYFIFILDNDISYRRLFTLPWRLMWPNTAITNCKYVSAYGSPGVWLHAKANN